MPSQKASVNAGFDHAVLNSKADGFNDLPPLSLMEARLQVLKE